MKYLWSLILILLLQSLIKAQDPDLGLQLLVGGFNDPVDIAHAGDSRLFIVEQGGIIKIIDGGTVLPIPFIDVSAKISTNGSERGLLGLVFHPSYSSNGFFYVNYTNTSGNTVVERYSVSGNPDVADAASGLIIITINQDFNNHNAGDLNFGPDGYLYIGMGDGGSGGDPNNRSQDGLNLLGKMLRIDVDNPSGGKNYGIPAGNPFVGNPNVLDEIWAIGLRNPWRFSFDSGSGDMFIADVGQDNWEEINHQPASSSGGENYGWRCYEGNATYNTSGCGPMGNYTFPVHVYSSSFPTGCSVTGGYVYRGTNYPKMQGKYIYTDYCYGRFWVLEPDGMGGWTNTFLKDLADFSYSSFGVDVNNELYVADISTGGIYEVVDNSVVVPVELISFKAYAKGEDVMLEWKTANEVNFDRYEVERSTNGFTWEKLDDVRSKSRGHLITNYGWTDRNVPTGSLYYRIRMVDLDGSTDYSPVRKISVLRGGNISVYPNPARAGEVLKIGQLAEQYLHVNAELISLTGRKVANIPVNNNQFRMPENISPGYYLIKIAEKPISLIITK